MPGLKGQIRVPRAEVRLRRNATGLSEKVDFIDSSSSVIRLADAGYLTLALSSTSGLGITAAKELTISLDTDPGLSLSTTGLKISPVAPLATSTSGLGLSLGTASCLAVVSNALNVQLASPLIASSNKVTLNLAATPGLEVSGGALQVKVPSNNLTVRDSTGIHTDFDELFRQNEVWR